MLHKAHPTIIILAIAGLLLLCSSLKILDLNIYEISPWENLGANHSYTCIKQQYPQVNSSKSGIRAINPKISSIKSIPNANKVANNTYTSVEIEVENNFTTEKSIFKILRTNYSENKRRVLANNFTSNIRNREKNRISESPEFKSVNYSTNSGSNENNNQLHSHGRITTITIDRKYSSDLTSDSYVDLTLFSDSRAQTMDGPQKAGINDPGTEELFGNPIPVPEGWTYLFILACIYIIIKEKIGKISKPIKNS